MTSGSGDGRDGQPNRSALPAARERAAPERKPTPVRALVTPTGAVDEDALDVEEVAFVASGEEWIARVVGRGGTSAPLLLVGFWPVEAADGEPPLETYRPGRTLAGLDEAALAELLAVARPRRVADAPASERSDTRRRGRRSPPGPRRGRNGDAISD